MPATKAASKKDEQLALAVAPKKKANGKANGKTNDRTKSSGSLAAKNGTHTYDESKVKTLSSLEHIRLRTGMYIGRLGDGTDFDDGIYILLKVNGTRPRL